MIDVENLHQPKVSPELLEKYDVAGPRYTSYPTADRFVEAFGEQEYKQALQMREIGRVSLPLSVYIHIPFCESLCFFFAHAIKSLPNTTSVVQSIYLI